MSTHASRRTATRSAAPRIAGGLLLIVIPGYLMFLIYGWAFAPHAAWQRPMTATVVDSQPHHTVAANFEDTDFTLHGDVFTIFGWRGFESKGATVKVWALMSRNSDQGTHVVAISQYRWPHQYHWTRIFLLFLPLCIIGAVCAGCGLSLALRK